MRWASLDEVCDINPRLPISHGLINTTEVSFVPMAAISETQGAITDWKVRQFDEVKKGYSSFIENDVLFAKITPCMENGKAAIARNLIGNIGFGSTEFHVLRARKSVLPEWIYYFVRQEAFRLEAKHSFTGTAGQQRVPATFLKNVVLPVPSLNEQQRIVDLLSRAEEIVRLRRQAQKKAAEIIPALFLDMFGDPAMNPKQWPIEMLSDVSTIISGVAKGRKLNCAEMIELPYMRVANVKDGHLDLSEIKTISIKRAEVEKLRIQPGDLLMTEGGDPDKLGCTALWQGEIDLCVHQNHVFKVRTDRSRLLPTFLRSLTGSSYGKGYFLSVAKKTTGIASINKTQLNRFPVVVPPIREQLAFGKHVAVIESIEKQQTDALQKIESTFNALLACSFANIRCTKQCKSLELCQPLTQNILA